MDVNGQGFTEHFNLKFQVEFQIGFLMKLSQNIHDTQCPWVRWFEHSALGARFQDFGNKGNNVK